MPINTLFLYYVKRIFIIIGILAIFSCRPDPSSPWTPMSRINAPRVMGIQPAVWTGSVMIVWGGLNNENKGAIYDLALDTWDSTSEAPICNREGHTSVWANDLMIVWGGGNEFGDFQGCWRQGGMYNPVDDEWALMSTENVPIGRTAHTAIWTGKEMIVWGGANEYVDDPMGGMYDPVTDQWNAIATNDAPTSRFGHTAIWTGKEMIVWGGYAAVTSTNSKDTNTGGIFNPESNSWRTTSTINAPTGRRAHIAIWTGAEMIVWGGIEDNEFLNTGGQYNPETDTWKPISTDGAPGPRFFHSAVWADSVMVVWGGCAEAYTYFNDGGIYDPSTDTWSSISADGAPSPRCRHTAIWTGDRMIIWGGSTEDRKNAGTGAMYDPSKDLEK